MTVSIHSVTLGDAKQVENIDISPTVQTTVSVTLNKTKHKLSSVPYTKQADFPLSYHALLFDILKVSLSVLTF